MARKKTSEMTPEEYAKYLEYRHQYYKAHPQKYKLTDEQKKRENARRRKKYNQDKEYREKCRERSSAYRKTDAGRESNRINQQRFRSRRMFEDMDRYFS